MSDSRDPKLNDKERRPPQFRAGDVEGEETYRNDEPSDVPAHEGLRVGFARENSKTVVTTLPPDFESISDEENVDDGPAVDAFGARATQIDLSAGAIARSSDGTDVPTSTGGQIGTSTAGDSYQSVDDLPSLPDPAPRLASEPSGERSSSPVPLPRSVDRGAATAFFVLPDESLHDDDDEETAPKATPRIGIGVPDRNAFDRDGGTETEILVLDPVSRSNLSADRSLEVDAGMIVDEDEPPPPELPPPPVAAPVAPPPQITAPSPSAPTPAPPAPAPVVPAPAAPPATPAPVAAPAPAPPAAPTAPPIAAPPVAAPPVAAPPTSTPVPAPAANAPASPGGEDADVHRQSTQLRAVEEDSEESEEDIDMMRWKVVPTAWAAKADEGAPPAPESAPVPPPKVAAEPPRALQTILWSETDVDNEDQAGGGRRIQSAFHTAGADVGSQAFHLAVAYIEDALGHLDEVNEALRAVDPDNRRPAQAAVMAAGQKLRRAVGMLSPKDDADADSDASPSD